MITARRPTFRPRQAHTGGVYMGEASPRAVQPPLRRGPIGIRTTTAVTTTGDVRWAPRAVAERD
jgi:hypothetical protein